MKQLMKIKSPKIHLHKISSLVFTLVFIILGVASPAISHATGDAYFSLSPASGSYTVGNTIVLSVSETSTSGDNTNAAQVNLSYPTALLQYQSITLNGPFTLCGQQTGGNGVVNIGCASTTVVSGTQAIAQVTFSVLASGSATVAMTSGSDIDNTSGDSVWNGVLPHASYTLSAASTGGGSSGGGGTTSPPSSGGSSGGTQSSGSPATPSAPKSTATTTPSTTTTAPAPSLSSLSVTVVNLAGKPIAGAKVTIDNKQTVVTNNYGVANFSGVPAGTYTVTVDGAGKKAAQTLVLTSGENKALNIKLDSSTSKFNYMILLWVAVILVILAIAGSIFRRTFQGRLNTFPGGTTPTANPVVMGQPGEITPSSTPVADPPTVVSPQTPPATNPTTPKDETIISPTKPPLPK